MGFINGDLTSTTCGLKRDRLCGRVSRRARDGCHVPRPICGPSFRDDGDHRYASSPRRDDPGIRSEVKIYSQGTKQD